MTTARARQMRKAMTPQELSLWLRLRALKGDGFHFRRQSPEAPYILDFVCRAEKLIVEVDGAQHAQNAAYDATRDETLAQRGFRTLRFSASDVQFEIDGVLATILSELGQSPTRRARTLSTPDTLPVPGRERGVRYQRLVRLGLRRTD